MLPFVLFTIGVVFLAAIVVIAVPFLDQGGTKVSVGSMIGRESIGLIFLGIAVVLSLVIGDTFTVQ